MGKENLEKNYIAPIIVGILLLSVSAFGINWFLDHQETKREISYRSCPVTFRSKFDLNLLT
jgi:hypothetical protein